MVQKSEAIDRDMLGMGVGAYLWSSLIFEYVGEMWEMSTPVYDCCCGTRAALEL